LCYSTPNEAESPRHICIFNFPTFSLSPLQLEYHEQLIVSPDCERDASTIITTSYLHSTGPVTIMADIRLSGSGLGIASLALQVSECIMRLKSFWDYVKDAPEEIKHLIEEIKTLSLVLLDFDTSEHPRHEATSRCYQSCKKAVGTLDSVVKEVESEIKKRKRVGSVKAVLKKGEIEKLRERLVTMQSMLMLANNMYLV
jgi:hypothetical protein